ncbi:unnamed protein product [Eretmochelys imbricata]
MLATRPCSWLETNPLLGLGHVTSAGGAECSWLCTIPHMLVTASLFHPLAPVFKSTEEILLRDNDKIKQKIIQLTELQESLQDDIYILEEQLCACTCREGKRFELPIKLSPQQHRAGSSPAPLYFCPHSPPPPSPAPHCPGIPVRCLLGVGGWERSPEAPKEQSYLH